MARQPLFGVRPADKGSAGVDGITFGMIEEYGVEEYLLDIQEGLQNKEYGSIPVKRVCIPADAKCGADK